MLEETEFYTNIQLPDGSWVSVLKEEFEIINNVIVKKIIEVVPSEPEEPTIEEGVQDA